MLAVVGLAVAAGILYKPLHLRYSYRRLRREPTAGNTKSFLSHGRDAVRLLEGLPEAERCVVVKTEDVLEGMVAPGAGDGCLHLTRDGITISIALVKIRKITFVE
jgi:hypothetical protein